MKPFLIVGAGAVGSSIGGYLARAGHAVWLVSREKHVQAIRAQAGLKVSTYEEDFLAPLTASVHPPRKLHPDTVIFLTVQASDVISTLRNLGELPKLHPVVTWQNGIQAENDAAPFCKQLMGGIVRYTSTLLDPGEVRLRRPGQLILGDYPEGESPLTHELARLLEGAGFRTGVASHIMQDKALKLLVNLVSGPAVLVRRTQKCPELAFVQVRLLEEGRDAFQADGLPAQPTSGLGQPLEEMIERFRDGGSAPDGKPVYNSTWQNLFHKRSRIENAYYHGEVIRRGESHGIDTPVNQRVLDLLEEVRQKGLGPEPWTPEEFRARFEDLLDFNQMPKPRDNSGGKTLEI
ncbi:MAG: ketopantoate reductase family protein [Candidatus Eisenbacteria bacterium]|uniref:Ketopantoate reductase family protein n=1 Tax=Eiseniibacteriota bacterium TaxID=2212470 RepID=A0A7Y2E9L9_UNCEI|nr:ketopantoate reductase family protein [Candidatus Eisenbacteria bacterium]